MRIKETNSLSDYIFYNNVTILICLSAFVIFLISLISNLLIRHNIYEKLATNCRYYQNEIRIEDGQAMMTHQFRFHNMEGILCTILDENEKVLFGEYPEKEFASVPFTNENTKKLFLGKTYYYVQDLSAQIKDPETAQKHNFIIRSMIECSLMDKTYEIIRNVRNLCILFLLSGCALAMYVVIKSIERPLEKICEAANRISQREDLSQHIELKDNMLDEIKVLVNAHNAMIQRAQELVEVQKQFSSDVAHELKTPVSVVIAECQFSSKYLTEDDDVRKAFGVIEEQARKTNDIINNLLELTRLEKNQFKTNVQYLDLSEIINSACDLEMLINTKNIIIHREIKTCYANVDLNLMLMAIRNIVNNAVKYSEENSEIFVRLMPVNDKILIQCEDYGCGMDEETQKHVFDRFYRADSSRNSEGLGLGMAITKKIIELHQGTIHLESEYGKGCIITIEIPA